MPKRRRLLTPMKKKSNQNKNVTADKDSPVMPEKEVSTARGRLKGALLEALEPAAGDESDTSYEQSPSKRERNNDSKCDEESDSDSHDHRRKSPVRQSYVLKLFDRSVDLSQFQEDSPLYPICRAWIANQPKADYSKFGRKFKDPEPLEDSVELPGPEGPPVSRIPELTPEQKASNVDNIDLDYKDPLPGREQLLQELSRRWSSVRRAWLQQSAVAEARYSRTQKVLNDINVNTV